MPKRRGPKPTENDFDADAAQLGHRKVTEFVNDHHDPDQDDEGENGVQFDILKVLHSLVILSFGVGWNTCSRQ